MIGQAISLTGKKYNVIILAAGKGTRMGEQSGFIPKALSRIGSRRAIDYIIGKYTWVADRFIISTGYEGDLLESYLLGKYPKLDLRFSRLSEVEQGQSNGLSLLYALDQASSRVGTIVVFCDLLVVSNNVVHDDSVLVVTPKTSGNVGTFRHHDSNGNGILGNFTFGDTFTLKELAYKKGLDLLDITEDILFEYSNRKPISYIPCEVVYEFGTENDLVKVRELWENA